MALVLDTGPLYASLDRRDADHQRCRRLIEQASESLVVPAPVLVEVDHWVCKWLGVGVFVALLDDIANGAYQIEEVRSADYARVREICDRYDESDVGFVDAAVLAVVESLKEPKLATLDRRHSLLLRPRHVSALRLMPE